MAAPRPLAAGQHILLCLSHVPWNALAERPRRLMVQAAADYQVVFWERRCALPEAEPRPFMRMRKTPEGVMVGTPLVSAALAPARADAAERKLLDSALFLIGEPVAVTWYYAPRTLEVAEYIPAPVMVFDCIVDGKPSGQECGLPHHDGRVIRKADLVLMEGPNESRPKRKRTARTASPDARRFQSAHDRSPAWQAGLPRPRIGYYGVVDERLDFGLLDAVARLRPSWQFIMLGPSQGLLSAPIPRRPNIHWHGPVCEDEFQACRSGWDAGFLPFVSTMEARDLGLSSIHECAVAGVPTVTTCPPALIAEDHRSLVLTRRQPEGVVAALQELMTGWSDRWQAQVDASLSSMGASTAWSDIRTLLDLFQPHTIASPPPSAGAADRPFPRLTL